jgi:hypothetical protein
LSIEAAAGEFLKSTIDNLESTIAGVSGIDA